MARTLLLALLLVISPLTARAQPCPGNWTTEFQGGSFDGDIRAAATYYDQVTSSLYVAGWFSRAGGVLAPGVAKWTGSTWVQFGGDFDGDVNALLVHTDGSLYAGGWFGAVGGVTTGRVARWNGTSWVAAGPNMITSGIVRALVSAPDFQNQSRLWAGGISLSTGSGGFGYVMRLDTNTWTFPAANNNALSVYCFGVYTEGTTQKLYAGGTTNTFPSPGNVLRFNGSNSWDPVGTGTPGVNGQVNAMGVFGDGSGVQLYIAGDFTTAGGQPASHIARWNGSTWSPVGAGIDHTVFALAGFDPDGIGPLPFSIFAAGSNRTAAGAPTDSVVSWNGSSWLPFGAAPNDAVYALAPFNLGNSLFFGGSFSHINSVAASRAASFTVGSGWSTMSNADEGNAPSGNVNALAWFDDDGAGPHPARLYVGGSFHRVGSLAADYLAIWDGASWSALPSSVNGDVNTLKVFDDGTGGGAALYVGGRFTSAGGSPALSVARWNGSSWSPLGPGINGAVRKLESYAPAIGPAALYVCGGFNQTPSTGIARWNGSTWVPVGINAPNVLELETMAVYDNGTGPRLYTAGQVNGAVPVWYWNGTTWTPTAGLSPVSYIDTMAVLDAGSGPKLYAGGSSLINSDFSNVAVCDGSTWTSVPNGPDSQVASITAHDDGAGPALYVGGWFWSFQNGQPATHLVRWNGSSWSSVPGQATPLKSSYVNALLSVDADGAGPNPATLFAGGKFSSLGAPGTSNLARLASCTCYANCDGSTVPPILNVNDFQCFLNKFAAADPSANCDQSTVPPILNINDFQCFINKFVVGCP